jgi:peptidoglycan/LPS O-acetylase OafA/YrhL
MDILSSVPAIATLIVAVTAAFFIAGKSGAPPIQGRFASIDGLRGYLAFFVFLSHSTAWYFYLRSGKWALPPSHLYTHFGQSSVALFFMITGFLFFSKLLDGRTRAIDWGKIFVSRFLRLAPLYFFVIFLLFLVVFILSNGTLNETVPQLLMGMARWLAFTMTGAPNLNGVENTWLITAGVTWSLPYEWKFYLSLPLLALTVGLLPPLAYIGLGIVSIVYLEIWHPSIHYLSFVGGIAAALLVRRDWFRRFAIRRTSSLLALACLAVTVIAFPTAYGVVPLFLLAVFFAIIASGNTLFGLLILPASRAIGEFAYGIYLLHGIILFVTFTFILGLPQSRELSSLQHWLVIVTITPVLIFICFLTFKFIEQPAMQKTTSVTTWLRSVLFNRFKSQAVRNTR